MITILVEDQRAHATWGALLDLAAQQQKGWTLIGAQMVALHGFERGRVSVRSSLDADVLANVRLVHGMPRQISALLQQHGFELDGVSATGVAHRFKQGNVRIDVLAPEGVSERTDLTTVPPNHTVVVPGGTQALHRPEFVSVKLGERVGMIPRPNLLGAILVKCRAVEVDDVPRSQRQDLAFLLSLCDDPLPLKEQITRTERHWLRSHAELLNANHEAWYGIENSEVGRDTLYILGDFS